MDRTRVELLHTLPNPDKPSGLRAYLTDDDGQFNGFDLTYPEAVALLDQLNRAVVQYEKATGTQRPSWTR